MQCKILLSLALLEKQLINWILTGWDLLLYAFAWYLHMLLQKIWKWFYNHYSPLWVTVSEVHSMLVHLKHILWLLSYMLRWSHIKSIENGGCSTWLLGIFRMSLRCNHNSLKATLTRWAARICESIKEMVQNVSSAQYPSQVCIMSAICMLLMSLS